jgi:hypothetical protein
MKSHSPTLEGFKAILRRPSLGLAEIAWRWSLGFMGVALLALVFVEYLDTLPVSPEDMFLLRTRHPALMGRAMEHIFHGSALRLLEAGVLLGLAFAVAWVVAASLGRAGTLGALLAYFSTRDSLRKPEERWRMRSLGGLNFFRAAATLAAAVGCWGAILLGGMVSSDKDPSPGSAVLIFLAVVMLVTSAWLSVNWFLSLASVLVVSDGHDTFGAIAATADLCRRNMGDIVAVSFWFGLARCVTFFIASSAVAFPLALANLVPSAVVWGGVALVSFVYFAVADFLYIGRLAAYLYIAEGPDRVAVIEVSPPLLKNPTTRPDAPADRMDSNEVILSDLSVSAGS